MQNDINSQYNKFYMLLHTKPRKFQTGGLTVPSGKIDIAWREMTPPKPTSPLDIDRAGAGYGYRGTSRTGLSSTGLPSDVKYLDGQIQFWTDKIKDGLAGSSDYVNSSDYKSAAEQLNKWTNARAAMLESREADYKSTAKRLAASTSDDLAVFGNKAIAKDNSTGRYQVVSTDELLSERVQDANGAMSTKYTPATVGEALRLRYEDPEFSGFDEDNGVTIDTILANVLDSGTVDLAMDKLFSNAGVINDTQTFISAADSKEIQVADLAALLNDAKTAYITRSMGTKSNANSLKTAVSYFSAQMTPEQRQALRGRAMSRFLQQYGTAAISAADAEQYIDDFVNADIAERASIYLTSSTSGKVSAKGSGSQIKSSEISETKKWYTNKIAYARAASDPTKRVTIEQKFINTDLGDHMNMLTTYEANDYNVYSELVNGFAKDSKGEPVSRTAANNEVLRNMTEQNLTGNFFLGDSKSTSISSLDDGEGLESAAPDLSTSGRNPKIIKDVPVSKDAQGNFKIEWEYLQQLMEWGTYEGKLEAALKKQKGVGNLSDEQRRDCAVRTSAELNFTPDERTDITYNDVHMTPILIYDKLDYNDPVGDVFAAADQAQIDYASEKLKWKKDRKIKFTYAFSVLNNDATAFSSDHYGKELKLADPVTVVDLVRGNENATKSANRRLNIVDIVSSLSVSESNK